jgi:Ino eighty subunit 2
MRRAEMARRRKNLSEKRNEEEKMDTINRLLKKQAPKRRGKASAAAELAATAAAGAGAGSAGGTPGLEVLDEMPEVERASPLFVRWVADARGARVGVPEEWAGMAVAVGGVCGGS